MGIVALLDRPARLTACIKRRPRIRVARSPDGLKPLQSLCIVTNNRVAMAFAGDPSRAKESWTQAARHQARGISCGPKHSRSSLFIGPRRRSTVRFHLGTREPSADHRAGDDHQALRVLGKGLKSSRSASILSADACPADIAPLDICCGRPSRNHNPRIIRERETRFPYAPSQPLNIRAVAERINLRRGECDPCALQSTW